MAYRLVTPYNDTDRVLRWLRQWLVAWRHQSIIWADVDLSSKVFSGIRNFAKNHEVNPHHVLAHHPRANAWWRHQMETFSALLALCEGNPPVTGDISFDLRLNKRLSKQSIHRWFETPSSSLWRHCDFSEHTHFDRVGLLLDVPYNTKTAKHSGWSALRLFLSVDIFLAFECLYIKDLRI